MPRLPSLLFLSCTFLVLAACQRDAEPVAAPAIAGTQAPDTPPPPNDTPAGQRIETDVHMLADDAMAGRETGTPGYDKASDYVAKRFAELGLVPAGDDGTYFQRVPLLKATVQQAGARLELTRDGKTTALAFKDEFLPGANYNAAMSSIEAPAVFVGQAVHAPAFGHDDFAGLDVSGKIAVVFGGAPPAFADTQRAFFSSSREKLRNLAERGAVGVVFVNTVDDEARSPWARAAASWDKPSMRLRAADGSAIATWPQLKAFASVSAAAADRLFGDGDRSAARLFEAARDGTLKGFDLPGTLLLAGRTQVEPLDSRNVVALVPGSDPALAGERIVHTAHLDHVGIGAEVNGDRIYNGALDNALGVAILLEAARELQQAADKPRRGNLFVALTAEEKGLLGAEWFATHPAAGTRLVANVNVDMPMLTAPTTDVVPIGIEHSSLKAVLETATQALGVGISPDPFPEEVVFVRSDQYAFVRAGIPALYLDGGVVAANDQQDPKVAQTWFLRNCYHQPCDQVDLPIHYGDAARLARLMAAIGRLVGNDDARPRWNDGDFFGKTFGKED